MMKIDVAGLGPADISFITKGVFDKLREHKRPILRTKIHPAAEQLAQYGIVAESYDDFYETATDFDSLYEKIAKNIIERAKTEDVLYCVPGSPLVAEKTVSLLREFATEAEVELTIHPALSFLDLLYERACIDPISGLAIIDAADEEKFFAVNDFSLVLTQVYNQKIASDVKLSLMERLDDEYEIFYAYHLGLPEEEIHFVKLYELDRIKNFDYLTSLYVKKQ